MRTNSCYTPQRCLLESLKILITLFLPLLTSPTGLLSTEFLDIIYNSPEAISLEEEKESKQENNSKEEKKEKEEKENDENTISEN